MSKDGLFNILAKIGFPPSLLNIVKSFRDDIMGKVVYDSAASNPFDILNGIKQGCVLAPTLVGIFFATLLNMLLENPRKASTYELCRMGIC